MLLSNIYSYASFVIDTQEKTLMFKFRIIPVLAGTESTRKSLMLLDDNVWQPSILQEGLAQEVLTMFHSVLYELPVKMAIREVLAHALFIKKEGSDNSSFADLFKVDPFLFLGSDRNFHVNYDLEIASAGEQIFKTLCLIVWSKIAHVSDNRTTFPTRTCIVCGNTQDGKVTGRANMSMTNICSFKSLHCLDPDCFSHKMNRMVNPAYKISEEAYENQKRTKVLK